MNKKRILLTGIRTGIGAACAKALLERNYQVVGLSRHATQSNFDQDSSDLELYDIDLSDLNALEKFLKGIDTNFDGAILNAGEGRFGSLEELSFDQLREQIDLNLSAHLFITRHLIASLKRKRGGDLIFIGSESGLSGGRRGVAYAAAKTGLQGLVRALRQEVSKNNIRVSIINPGMVETPFFDDLNFEPGEEDDQHLVANDIAKTVIFCLESRDGSVIDEINLTPQKTVLRFKNK